MRTSSRVRVVLTTIWALAAATASAQDVFYLRAGGTLSADAPAAGAVTTAISSRIRAADLARRLQIFVAKVLEAKRGGHLPTALHDRLVVLAGEAIDAIPDR